MVNLGSSCTIVHLFQSEINIGFLTIVDSSSGRGVQSSGKGVQSRGVQSRGLQSRGLQGRERELEKRKEEALRLTASLYQFNQLTITTLPKFYRKLIKDNFGKRVKREGELYRKGNRPIYFHPVAPTSVFRLR